MDSTLKYISGVLFHVTDITPDPLTLSVPHCVIEKKSLIVNGFHMLEYIPGVLF